MKQKKMIVNGIPREITISDIKVRRVYSGEFQKEGTFTAELEQEWLTKSLYPTKKVSSSMNDTLFETKEFGFEEQEFESKETRIAWILVPTNAKVEDIVARLSKLPDAIIYKVLANKPVLDENQIYAISQGQRTLDDYANKQALRYPENAKTLADGTAGTLILDKEGKVQYRKTYFSTTHKEDIEMRFAGKDYLSPELEAELLGAGVIKGQTV